MCPQAGKRGRRKLGKLTRKTAASTAQTKDRSGISLSSPQQPPQSQANKAEDGAEARHVGEERGAPEAPAHARGERREFLGHHRFDQHERGHVPGKPVSVGANDPRAERVSGQNQRRRQITTMNQPMQIIRPSAERPLTRDPRTPSESGTVITHGPRLPVERALHQSPVRGRCRESGLEHDHRLMPLTFADMHATDETTGRRETPPVAAHQHGLRTRTQDTDDDDEGQPHPAVLSRARRGVDSQT